MREINLSSLQDKVCIITGGGGVIGRAVAKGIASAGVKTVILDRNQESADKAAMEVIQTTGTPSLGVVADVLDKKSLEFAREKINNAFGKIHFLINGAGGNSPQATTNLEKLSSHTLELLDESFYGLQEEGFTKVFDLNFLGTVLPTMVFTRDMLQDAKGSVINISSMNSYRPLTKIPAYSAAKAAINNFTQWLAVHLANTGIRVNAIAPGFFLTNQNRFLLIDEKSGESTDRGKRIIESTPMGKYGDPDDVTGAVAYLLSDLSSFVTGIIIPVDGGYSAFGGV